MTLNQITHVKIPILEWSARSNYAKLLALANNQDSDHDLRQINEEDVSDSDAEETETNSVDYNALRKIVIVGDCLLFNDDK
jgi:hypothetical protein